MKIALLTDGIHPYVIGGMQKHSYYLTKYLTRNGAYVDLYHTPFRHALTEEIKNTACFTEEEKKYIRSFVINFPQYSKLPGHYLRESYEYSRRVFGLFRKESQVDFIYAKGFSGWKLLEEKRKGFRCAPIGIKFHGMNMFQKPPSFRGWLEQLIFRPPVKFNMMNADYVFSYGGKITNVIQNIGIDNSKIIELQTGVERDWLIPTVNKQDKIRRFLFLGRYERLKGIEELSSAILPLLSSYAFEFHFAGNIPDRKKIISDKIIYYGTVTDSENLKMILDGCDILVCPSYSEGMPNVILEAMARGLAIIATDVGAVNLMVSEENGWLLEGPDVRILQKTLEDAIRMPDEELRKKKYVSLRKVKENFLWENIVFTLINKIKTVIS